MMLKIKRIADVEIPKYETEGAACFDIAASRNVKIEPGDTVLVPTGLVMEVPETYEVQIRPRSGVSYKTKLRIANAPGTIDSDYRGEVHIIMDNIGTEPEFIKKGQRIAQGKMEKAEQVFINDVDSVSSTKRDEGGFGSTG